MKHITANTTPLNPNMQPRKEPRIKSEQFKTFDSPDPDTVLVDLRSEQKTARMLEGELNRLQAESEMKEKQYEKTIAEIKQNSMKNMEAKKENSSAEENYKNLQKENEELVQRLKFITNASGDDILAAKDEINYWINQCKVFDIKENLEELKQKVALAKRKRRKYHGKYKKAKETQGMLIKTLSGINEDEKWKIGMQNIQDEALNIRKELEQLSIQGGYEKKK